jgi:gliding motility-associated-like protein
MAITKATASSIAPAAKGDLVAGSATNDAAVLGVGANDTVLTADSSTATGLKWATPSSPSLSGVGLTTSVTVNVPNNSATAVLWNTEEWDTNGFHSTVTNTSRITIPTGAGGYYLINASVQNQGTNASNIYRQVILRKNGTGIFTTGFDPANFQMEIYNRWGELFFQSFNANKGWDGYFDGKLAPLGTYIWKIRYKNPDLDDYKDITGHVNLIR